MAEPRTWETFRKKIVTLLERRTGEGLAHWNARVRNLKPKSEAALKTWLAKEGVTGYPQMLLVMEHFGYPEFLTASADDLLDGQYKSRQSLRPVYDKVAATLGKMKGVEIQIRKTYVSILTPRRTFARVQASKSAVHVALRLDGRKPGGRLHLSKVHDTMPVELRFTSAKEIDREAIAILREAYEASL